MHSAIVIGAGAAGATRKEGNHARSITRHPRLCLAGLYDVDRQAAEDAARLHGGTAFASLEDALGQRPALAVIAVHPQHRRDIWSALWACPSVRHVICEKPFALSIAEAEWVTAGCAAAGKGVSVNFQRRLHPTYLGLKHDLDSGRRGAVQNVTIHYTRGLRTNACHWLDLMVMLFGPPLWVSAETSPIPSPYEGDPNATIVLGYPRFHAQLVPLITWHDAFYTGDVDIIFQNERIFIPSTTNYAQRHARRWVVKDQMLEEADVDFEVVNPQDDFYAVIDMAADILAGDGGPAGDPERETWPVRLIDLAEQSCREHRRVEVAVP